MMPKRIQRKRTKGWKRPDNSVYVGRPTKWGNPFVISGRDHKPAVRLFERHCLPCLPVHELRGKDLACWCPLDETCHADVLLKAANE